MAHFGEPSLTALAPTTASTVIELVQVIDDRGRQARHIKVTAKAAEREGRQYINVDRRFVARHFEDGAHPEYGPSVLLCARLSGPGNVVWNVHEGSDNLSRKKDLTIEEIKKISGLADYEPPGFDSRGSGRLTTVTAVGEDHWTETVEFFLSTYGGDAFVISATADDGQQIDTLEFRVWRKLWYDIVEMRRPQRDAAPVGTFQLDARPSEFIRDVQGTFKDVFIEVSPEPVHDEPSVGEHEDVLTDETSEVWMKKSRSKGNDFAGLKFNLAIVDRYPEQNVLRAFLRFETFHPRPIVRFSYDAGCGEVRAFAARMIPSRDIDSHDKYWFESIYVNGDVAEDDETTIQRYTLAKDVDDKTAVQPLRIPTTLADHEACYRGVADPANDRLVRIKPGGALVHPNEKLFLLRCNQQGMGARAECEGMCLRWKFYKTPRQQRFPRLYERSFFGSDMKPLLDHVYEPPVRIAPATLEEELLVDINDGDGRFETPVYVEVEVETDASNIIGGSRSTVIGNASAGSSSVFINRGEIEATTLAGPPGSPAFDRDVRAKMIRVTIHELGHALGLLPQGATWADPENKSHCATEHCPMWPMDDPAQAGFHGGIGVDSCHNFLCGKIMTKPFAK